MRDTRTQVVWRVWWIDKKGISLRTLSDKSGQLEVPWNDAYRYYDVVT